MKPRLLPPVIGEPFLAGDGFVGFRCPCGYVTTGRSLHAVDFAIYAHQQHAHPELVPQAEETDATT